MKYIHATTGSLIALVVFAVIAFFTPSHGYSEEITVILTVSTFLFAIIAGFYMSRLNSRYNSIISSISNEDALWFSAYEEAKLFGKDFLNKLRELLNEYYINAYDFPLAQNYKPTQKIFDRIHSHIASAKGLSDPKKETAFSKLEDILIDLEKTRNAMSISQRSNMGKGQWIILVILGSIIIFSIFYLRNSGLYSQITAVFLSTVLVLLLLVMRDLQNLSLGGKIQVFESGQELFEHMGLLRYYRKEHFTYAEGVPKSVKKYRLGVHKPGGPVDIKIVERES